MCDNIVMFGPTHSGKSTLLGYLVVYDLSQEQYVQNNVRIRKKIEEDLGSRYKKDMALAYYVDTGKDERMIYDKDVSSLGGSKRIHIHPTSLGIDLDCTFIDTPGADQAWKHKYEGVFLGDLGIFIIEIGKLIDLSRKREGSNAYNAMVSNLFSPIYLWKHYKRMRRLIIVISKVDLAKYSQYAIKRAENVLRSIDILKEVPIIPISIDVESRKSNNVVGYKRDDIKWYTGISLVEQIKELLKKEYKENKQEFLTIAHIERPFEKTKSNNQPAIRIKVLNGSIHTGDEVYIGPVRYNKRNEMLKGLVLSIKHETRGMANSLSTGDIGGIIFSKLWVGRDRIKLTDVQLKRTSMIYNDISECRSGNLLYFNIDKKDLNQKEFPSYDKCNVGARIKIIWFGKVIPMHLLNIIDNGNSYAVVLMNTSSQESMFMLPLRENGRLFYEDYVLQITDILFVNARLSDIELVSDESRREVLFTFEGQIPDILNYNILLNSGLYYEFTLNEVSNETSLLFRKLTAEELKKVMDTIRKIIKEKKIKNYKISILPHEK